LPRWPGDLDCETAAGLKWFVETGYFFVQAMKWPLAASYNAQRRASRLALQHALTSHLENEIELIRPQHIVALGGAAWDACAELSGKHGRPLSQRLGVDLDRLRHHTFRMANGQDVSLHVTRLPGRQNERFRWAKVTEHDIATFLECDPRQNSCETVDRLSAPQNVRGTHSKEDRQQDAESARQLLRRLKVAGLWPPEMGSLSKK
jgi:hypothetical protein